MPDVEITGWSVKIQGQPEVINATYGQIVRGLSSYGRSAVRYTPCHTTVMQAVQDALQDAVERAAAELHLRGVAAQHDGKEAQSNPDELFANDVCSILLSKTKRLKQHCRRSRVRAEKKGLQVKSTHSWPKDVLATAIDFQDGDQDLFMHVAIKVMAGHFNQQGLQVRTQDGIRVWQLRGKLKELLEKHADCIGVSQYELLEVA